MYSKPHLRVLVVDEQHEYFDELKDWADMCSHQMSLDCRHVQCGREAMGVLRDWEPDVVLLDLHLPDIPSFDLISRCCSKAIPVVATGNAVDDEVRDEAVRQGAFAYLTKTPDPDEMDEVLGLIVSAAQTAIRQV